MWASDRPVDAPLHMQEIRGDNVTDVVERTREAMAQTGYGRVGEILMLVPELVAEIEQLRSVQGLSVNIPGHGEWGSETLAYLFLDFGIQPGDGYETAVARQGDLLRELAAANAEVERLRAALDALKKVIEHVDDDGKVPMAYILCAQTALAALEADR